MSKDVRVAIGFAIVLIIFTALGFVWAILQRQNLLQQNQSLQEQVSEYQSKEKELLARTKKMQDDAEHLTQKVSDKEQENSRLQGSLDEFKRKADDLSAQFDQARRERDDWKDRLDTIRRERDDLAEKFKSRPTQIVYKERPAEPKPVEPSAPAEPVVQAQAPSVTTVQGEDYWAQVLKQKAVLQLELDKVKGDLDKSVGQIADLKKQNSDLQLQIKSVTNDKEEIEGKIKYGEDLANSLSIELARARNDQKFVGERADKLKDENIQLQGQIRQLTGTKLALEKTITRLGDQKDAIQKKLVETESVIQGRIDEIWQIKESLDRKLADSSMRSSAQQVDLPPIIVNANGNAPALPTPAGAQAQQQQSRPHAILSMNETNNFVIVDLGADSGVKVGNILKVIRSGREIATLEVIQVRKDICAADIKQKTDTLKVGDVIQSFVSGN